MNNKYLRIIRSAINGQGSVEIDIYAVLEAYAVTCPARQHAIKKLLCAGIRGKGDSTQDLTEAKESVERAIQMEVARQQGATK